MPHGLHGQLAGGARAWTGPTIHVITPQVGGGFGGKAGIHAEYIGRRRGGAPARPPGRVGRRRAARTCWRCPTAAARSSTSSSAARDDGTFTGLRVRLVGDAGAYPAIGAFLPGRHAADVATARTASRPSSSTSPSPSPTPRRWAPTAAPGGPRPRRCSSALVDQAAHRARHRPDRAAPPQPARPTTCSRSRRSPASPTTPAATASRSTSRRRAVGYDELRAEQAARRDRGDRIAARHRRRRLRRDHRRRRRRRVRRASRSTTTARPPCCAGTLGPRPGPPDGVRHDRRRPDRHPDRPHHASSTATPTSCRTGGGTGGSRSLQLGGSAVHEATEALVDKAKQLAAHLLEADVADIVVDTDAGTVGVAGVPAHGARRGRELRRRAAARRIDGDGTLGRRAARLRPGRRHVPVRRPHRRRRGRHATPARSRSLRHVAVDDCGTVLNPLLVEGQQHGGIAAGIGQALYEEVALRRRRQPAHRPTSPTTRMPSAAELPSLRGALDRDADAAQPARRQGHRRGGTIGSTPAVQNAVIDAVAHLGVRHIDMPCTPERVWRAITRRRGRHARPTRGASRRRSSHGSGPTAATAADTDEAAAAADAADGSHLAPIVGATRAG